MPPDEGRGVRLQFYSDLHLEMPLMQQRFGENLEACAALAEGREPDDAAGADAGAALPRPARGTYLALLGDIFNGQKIRNGAYRKFLLQEAPGFEAVFVLAGNHEFYNSEYLACREALRALCDEVSAALQSNPPVIFMDCGRLDVPGTSVRVLGCTLWSRVVEEQAEAVGRSLNDYMAISVLPEAAPAEAPPPGGAAAAGGGATAAPAADTVGGSPSADGQVAADSSTAERPAAPAQQPKRRCATVADTNSWHRRELEWLEGELASAKADGRRCVVLTHHAPTFHEACAPEHRASPINSGFCSGLERLLRPPVAAWLYGHTHWNTRQSFRALDGEAQEEGLGRWSSLEAELDRRGLAACRASEGEVLVASNQMGYATGEHRRVNLRPSLVLELPPDGREAVLRCRPRQTAA